MTGTITLIAGPTAAGKSALALSIARTAGAVIVNADALQVYDGWRVLTARPAPGDEAAVPHRLYGTVGMTDAWSVGHWLRAVGEILAEAGSVVIVGGTGLYFRALTEGLVDIPPTPPALRAEADAIRAEGGTAALLATLDPETRALIDPANPMRVQRAWEVLRATGQGLAGWHRATPPPLVPGGTRLLVGLPTAVLDARIALRLRAMVGGGALDEVAANRHLDPALPAMQALGARALAAHLRGETTLDTAVAEAVTATRQYAKRQRTWFRTRMRGWTLVAPPQ